MTGGDPGPYLEARGLTKVYFRGTPDELAALVSVSASFAPGGLHLVWGASGSGKTTLLSLLGALDHPTAGEVVACGEALATMTEPELALYRRRRVGFLFQSPTLLPGVPLWANVTLSLVPDGWPDRARREAAASRLAEFGLLAKIDRSPEQLSGGEAHRASLARALIREPAILLADEPTSQLDSENAERVLEALVRLAATGRVVVVASHDHAVRAHARSITELVAGRTVASGAAVLPAGCEGRARGAGAADGPGSEPTRPGASP